jgi:UDPglucose--hexose-1-phosphate uridylyltransferase
MSELRKDPIIGRWVVIATERKFRPSDFSSPAETQKETFCPFCPGNEDKTPSEIYAKRPGSPVPNSPGWEIRVVPNKFPALRIEGDLNRKGTGMYDMMNGIGAHEVIIETPLHIKENSEKVDIKDYNIATMVNIIETYQIRSIDLKKDPRFRYVLVFKNFGKEAGASLSHPHSQIIATPVVPKRVKEELMGAKWYYEYKERCVWCDIINQELDSGKRIVEQNESFLAIAPFASRFPFELSVIPFRHSPDFEDITPKEKELLAGLLLTVFKKISKGLNNPSYNVMLHTAPCRYPRPGYWQTIEKDYHWHLEIMPRLVKQGGFEWGTGFYINPTPPEEVADFLKSLPV